MTAALRINGITMPVADGSADTSIDRNRRPPRAVNAQQLIARRAVKQVSRVKRCSTARPTRWRTAT